MRKLTVLFFTIILLSSFSSPIFSQNDEDSAGLQELLLLLIPEETDNPNYALTFTDPTDKGVFLSIDGAEEKEIRSPYELPSLGIGDHTLRVRFTDDTDTERTYEDTIVILPRPPQIDTPTVEDNALIVTGTGLPASKLNLFVSGADRSFRESVKVTDQGDWEATIEGDFSTGIYNAVGYVSKNGYGSDLSEPVTFSLETSITEEKVDEPTTPIFFSFSSITTSNIKDVLLENRDLMIVGGGIFLIALILGVLLSRIIFFRSERKIESTFKAVLQGKKREPIKDILKLDKEHKEDSDNEKAEATAQQAPDQQSDEEADVDTSETKASDDGDQGSDDNDDTSDNDPDKDETSDASTDGSSEDRSSGSDTTTADEAISDEDDTTDQTVDKPSETAEDTLSDPSSTDDGTDENSTQDGSTEEAAPTNSEVSNPDPATASTTPASNEKEEEGQKEADKKPSFLDKLKSMTLIGKKKTNNANDPQVIPVPSETTREGEEGGLGDISEPDDPGGITGLPEDLQEPASSKPTVKVSKSAGLDPYEDVEPAGDEIPVYETEVETQASEASGDGSEDTSEVNETESDQNDTNDEPVSADSDAEIDSDTDPSTENDSPDTVKEVSAEEFLEKFKTADPDPDGLDQVVPADETSGSDNVQMSPTEGEGSEDEDTQLSTGDGSEDHGNDETAAQTQEARPSMTEKLGAVGIYTPEEETEKKPKKQVIKEEEEEDVPRKTGTKKKAKKKTSSRSKTSTKKSRSTKKSKTTRSTAKKNEKSEVKEYESKNRFQEVKDLKTKPLGRIKRITPTTPTKKKTSKGSATPKTKKKRNITISLTSKKK